MRSELYFLALAPNGDPCGPECVHRDSDREQLRFLVRGRRLPLACRHEVALPISGSRVPAANFDHERQIEKN